MYPHAMAAVVDGRLLELRRNMLLATELYRAVPCTPQPGILETARRVALTSPLLQIWRLG